jgi:hypothetical protein
MAGGQGFEPRFRGPEPRVLPLHHPPLLSKKAAIIAKRRSGVHSDSRSGIRNPNSAPSPVRIMHQFSQPKDTGAALTRCFTEEPPTTNPCTTSRSARKHNTVGEDDCGSDSSREPVPDLTSNSEKRAEDQAPPALDTTSSLVTA